MRIREVISEQKFSTRKSDVLSATWKFPTMPSSDPYQIYRFGVAMADHTLQYAEGPAAQSAIITAYTPEEEDIVHGAEKTTGHKGELIADKASHEPDSSNKVSPVAKRKPNRYGV